MKTLFHALADHVQGLAGPGETIVSGFRGEVSDFIRFNRSRVRQATTVRQAVWTLSLVEGGRRVDASTTLAGDPAADRDALSRLVAQLRDALAGTAPDPYLLLPDSREDSDREEVGSLPEAGAVIESVLAAGRGVDLVGFHAAGPIFEGHASSSGQRNWQRVDNFNFEWCLYHDRDKAVKTGYAGREWSEAAFAARMDFAREQLALLARPARTLEPGRYRAYLTPAALDEVTGLLGWGGFGLKSQRTRQSPLGRLVDGTAALDARVTITENTAEGLAPGFQGEGFVRPARVPLVAGGRHAGALASPRSAREYGVATNGANGGESPESLDLAAGTLPRGDVLAALDRGIYVGNLWYLNYSDRTACRMTGMTRFASFWVEGGRIVAPLNVMRFDDTLYRMLGSELEHLTAERDLLPSSSTYLARSTASSRLPGALLRELTLTL